MATRPLPSLGEQWTATKANLAKAYGWDEDKMEMAIYAVAEQIHRHYCLSRGIVNHAESRPDQDVALSVLGALAGVDWWMVKSADLAPLPESPAAPPEEFVHYGDDSVMGWADDSTQG